MTDDASSSGAGYRPWVHRFAMMLVAATFVLVVAGGTVTSKGAGLAVPDWPTSYGYNMFLFPPSLWVGNIFWEHVHRLLGSLVGMMSIAMMITLWCTQPHRRWLSWVGVGLVLLVVIQGVMGGLRVTELSTALAVLHAVTAQVILCLTVCVAAVTSRLATCAAKPRTEAAGVEPPVNPLDRAARGAREGDARHAHAKLRVFSCVLLAVLLIQLTLGASMRHTGAGLAIPDFPLAYGRLVPPLSPQAISDAVDSLGAHSYAQQPQLYTVAQVSVHYAHRIVAMFVLLASGLLWVQVARWAPQNLALRAPARWLGLLLVVQVLLGAAVIWSGRHPELATAHHSTGAATLAVAALLSLRIHCGWMRVADRRPILSTWAGGLLRWSSASA